MLLKRYEPHKVEELVKKFWNRENVYLRLKERRGRKFYFLDGPPYPSSDVIHVGTGWNKVIKDVVVRFRRMRGFDVWDRPGYDCHGLPIEVAAEKMLGFKTKKDIEEYGIGRFIEKCKEIVMTNVPAMTEQFKELGVFMDWDNPYMTLEDDYIESGWWLLKKAEEQGLLHRGLKVMHWCPRCETVLADYEVREYRDVEDPSIYVKLSVEGREGEFIIVWTTTPWTLPANVAVMVHPEFEYARVRVGGEVYILARDRIGEVLGPLGAPYEVMGILKGKDLEGLKYIHPLEDEVPIQKTLEGAHVVVLSDKYVRAEEGTGCVHTAPGHGEEDFEVGQEYGLPVLSPVDDRGVFTKEAGKYAGLPTRQANGVIIQDLRRKGLLLRLERVVHKYPVCWRCKTPLIFRATEQWFLAISRLKDRMLGESEKVRWVPEWAGRSRFRNWLLGARDWVISRQRYWGTPLPIWICGSCGNRVVVGSRDELEELAMNKVELRELHRPWVDRVLIRCGKCGGKMRRVEDVMDVWFDSGVSFFASLGYPRSKRLEELWPVDFIVEGHDQISGWFYSLLRTSMIGFGEAPYRTVLMHGFALDEKGHEMHKSLGNFVSAPEAIKPYGRDTFRLYVLSNTIWEDLRFSWNGLREAYEDLNIAWNVFNFALTYMSLDKFRPSALRTDALRVEDRWILSRLESVKRDVTRYLEEYNIHLAARLLRRFIVEDVSRTYIKLIRRRVWIEEADISKMSAYETLYRVLLDYLLMMAPIAPFFSEYWFQRLARRLSPGLLVSVHLMEWPPPREELLDEELEEQAQIAFSIIEDGLAARNKAGIKLRQPLRSITVYTDDLRVRKAVDTFKEAILAMTNVKTVNLYSVGKLGEVLTVDIKPVYPKLGPLFREKTKTVLSRLQSEDPELIARAISERGYYQLKVDGELVKITKEQLEVVRTPREGYELIQSSYGFLALDTRISEDERIEGLAREFVRRIQFMRKILDLLVEAYIDVEIAAPEDIVEDVQKMEDYIKVEARIRKIKYLLEGEPSGRLVQKWDIGGSQVLIGIDLAK